jgi:predicted RNA binding protein YcfA (HicA-like mRNA interferase family)
MRVKGSHHIFRKEGVLDMVNIQKDGNMVKPYQVKQIRAIFAEYNLIGE